MLSRKQLKHVHISLGIEFDLELTPAELFQKGQGSESSVTMQALHLLHVQKEQGTHRDVASASLF